ncbi:MAG: glucose/galactose MFS transporter [Alphaproteobacteria bacterium]|nr:glucose/galactose MFS transporter [Alphaproteobacteria bacterium]
MDRAKAGGATAAFITVTSLFFAWGFITSIIDPLIAAVKGIYSLNNREALLTQFAFFISYGIVSLPAAALLTRAGHVRTILLSLAAMLAACLIILLATFEETYNLVLFGLFVLGSGITALQVAANPLSAALGDPAKSHFRLVLSQAFNSLGTVIGPYLGARIMLQGAAHKGGAVDAAARTEALGHIHTAFLVVAGLMALLIAFIWTQRRRIEAAAPGATVAASPWGALRSSWALFGALAIFLYVGAEVSIGSLLALFLAEPRVFAMPLEKAAELVSLYWLGAMIGRFAGSALLTRLAAANLLAFAAAVAVALCLVALGTAGPVAGYAAIAVGLFNSIMFPTIFTLALERSTASHASTSGLLCVAIVGGAFLPQLYGHIADVAGRSTAYAVPAAAYAVIVLFALAARRARIAAADIEPPATIH